MTEELLKSDGLSPTARWLIGGAFGVVSILVGGSIYQTVDAHDAAPESHLTVIVNHNDKVDAHLALQNRLVKEVGASVISANAMLIQMQTTEIIDALKKR